MFCSWCGPYLLSQCLQGTWTILNRYSSSLSDNLSVCCLNPLFTCIYIYWLLYVYNIQGHKIMCDTYHIMGTNDQMVQCLSFKLFALWGLVTWTYSAIPMDSWGFQHDAGDRNGHLGRIRPGDSETRGPGWTEQLNLSRHGVPYTPKIARGTLNREDDWAIGLCCILEYFRFGKTHVGMGHTYPHWAVLY